MAPPPGAMPGRIQVALLVWLGRWALGLLAANGSSSAGLKTPTIRWVFERR